MNDIDDKYPWTTAEDSVREKDWAAGTTKLCDVIDYYYDGTHWRSETKTFSPAWLKLIDEIVVNALDHIIRCLLEYSSNKVSSIKASFDGKRVTITNDGEGVEVVEHPRATRENGKLTYVPTHIFGTLFNGSNRKKTNDSIIGGTNGVGAKIGSIMSDEFTVITVDSVRKLRFEQTWRDGKRTVEEPKITKYTQKSFTTFTFIPSVHTFGDTSLLTDVVRTRMEYASAYARLCNPKITISFNDNIITSTIHTIVRGICGAVPAVTICTNGKFNWEIALACAQSQGVASISIVNGIIVRTGSHFTYVKNIILNEVRTELTKTLDISKVNLNKVFAENFFLMINAQIPNSIMSWDGQRKDNATVDTKSLNIKLPKIFMNEVIASFQPIVESMILGKRRVKKVEYEKYIPPESFLGEKPILIFAEGDSAMNQLKIGLLATTGLKKIGLISLGGVPMNLRKKCTSIKNVGNQQLVKLTDKAVANAVFKAIFDIIGLNMNYKYDKTSPTYAAEISKLKFRQFVGAVDQDLDGKGNILGLMINTFNLLWPHLVDVGFLGWLNTPIVRCFEKIGSCVLTFYTESEFKEAAIDVSKFNIQYYKGLGTHSKESIVDCCCNLGDKIITFHNDDTSLILFDRYYGKSSEPRKVEMRKPLGYMSSMECKQINTTHLMSTSDLLKYETAAYCKDNLERKLDSAIDGQNQAGRKILHCILRTFVVNTPMRVAQLAGAVSEKENYHHGEASLAASITSRAFIACGGKQLPFLLPLSDFGTRLCGGKTAASPRYIYTKLNNKLTDILFNREDYYILEFNFSEGVRCEPKYYIPCIPLAVCESTQIPSTGWKLETWARSIYSVCSAVINMIKYNVKCGKLDLYKYSAMHHWTGELTNIRGMPATLGNYYYEGDVLHITELPLRVWNMDYVSNLKKSDEVNLGIIDSLYDYSNDLKVNIKIKLKPGSIERLINRGGDLCYTDPIEEYFGLYSKMNTHLNLMMPNYSIKEYAKYEDVVDDWFILRKELYTKRVERSIILQSAKIVQLEEQLRYAVSKLKVGDLSKYDQTKLLESNGFKKINATLIGSPGFTSCEALQISIFDDDYDKPYKYLLDMRDSDKSKEKIVKLTQQINTLKKELDAYKLDAYAGSFVGSKFWLNELDALLKVVEEGHRTAWQFKDFGRHKY